MPDIEGYSGRTLGDYLRDQSIPETMDAAVEALIDLQSQGGFVAIYHSMDEVDIEEFKPNINFALVVGAEQYGISDNWFESKHTSIRIRSTNNVDSLNASTAAAIGMWELTK